MKHHNPPSRNLTLKNLEDEVIVAWNGPQIQHADNVIKETIDLMQGAGKWHFIRSSKGVRLKFYHVSEAVDALQNVKSTFSLNSF